MNTQKLEMTIGFRVTGNNPDKAIDKFIEKMQEQFKSEWGILEEKGYILEGDMYYRKLVR